MTYPFLRPLALAKRSSSCFVVGEMWADICTVDMDTSLPKCRGSALHGQVRVVTGSFVLNARTDAYMIRRPDAFAETVRRAERYLASGADCIFVPGVTAAEEIGRLTAAIGAPVNVVSGLTDPVLDAATLRSLGVARISVGGTLARAVLTLVERAAR